MATQWRSNRREMAHEPQPDPSTDPHRQIHGGMNPKFPGHGPEFRPAIEGVWFWFLLEKVMVNVDDAQRCARGRGALCCMCTAIRRRPNSLYEYSSQFGVWVVPTDATVRDNPS